MKVSNLNKNFIIILTIITVFNIMNAKLTPLKGLQNLKSANKKFVNNSVFREQRKDIVKEQNPSYVILSCSDSRVTPEYIFDQPLGNIFSVRTAGQVVDNIVIDTIEFAVKHFDVVNLIVMGHQNCGAVNGALNRLKENNGKVKIPKRKADSFLDAVLIPIERAIVAGKVNIHGPHAFERSIIANIKYISNQLKRRSSVIRQAIKDKKIKLLGAVYSLETGKVEFIS